jgi:hypothetical protein
MNDFVATRYVETVQRVALGIEPIDAMRRLRVAHPIEIAVEGLPLPDPLTPLFVRLLTSLRDGGRLRSDRMARAQRHSSCRYVLTYKPGLPDHFNLRIFDRAQRFVPRRLHVPLVPLADPADPTLLDAVPLSQRSFFPRLFPGAAYDVTDNSATGLRGRVVRDDPAHPGETIAVRWPRIEARRNGTVVGRAHGDQNGEFLLLLESGAVAAAGLPTPFTLNVEAFAPPLPAPPPALVVATDPLWDMPLETVAALGAPSDPVAAGETVPAAYTQASGPQPVTFTFGALISSGIAPLKIS